jgi:hypothetical protein
MIGHYAYYIFLILKYKSDCHSTSRHPPILAGCYAVIKRKYSLKKERCFVKMKAKALREKREFLNIREMVEFIGEEYKGRVAYRYRINPHDKDQVKITYDEMPNHIRAVGTEMISRGA